QILSSLVGLPLNCYMLFLLFTEGVRKDIDVTFNVSQCASEILLSFTAPLSIACHLNSDLCVVKALGFFWGISMSARCHFQCCVCLERYIAVVHPITFLKYNRARYRLPCAVVSWIDSLVCAVSTMFSFPQLPFSTLAAIFSFLFIVDLFCFLMILKALRETGPCDMESDEAGGKAFKRRAFKLVCVNLMVSLVQSLPLLYLFFVRQKFSLEVFNFGIAISLCMNFSAGFVHPIVFLHRAK
ncbi:uracil nucleotide/cysteinyl leukotriene receptor-like, partial [Silurus asotus]